MKAYKKYGVSILALLMCCSSFAQHGKKHISLKDSLDGKFDLSDYIIDANGFVPVPYIITEPALGGFGGALIPVFIKKRPPYLDSVRGQLRRTAVPPDVTGGILAYTVNNSWIVAAFRSGTFIKSRIKYLVGFAYSDLRLSFYRTFDRLGEKELQFSLRTFPLILQATKRIGISHWYGGLKYVFLKTETRYMGNRELDSLGKTFESAVTVSQLGTLIERDTRDNIFTPDKGSKLHIDGIYSGEIVGSDYEFWKMNYYIFGYRPISKKIIGGLRLDGQQTFGDIPFYLLPYISMRGIPAVRYQGKATILSEMEMRWDVVPRWSVMLYGGAGKAFDDWDDFGSAEWVGSGGTGFRYLLARKFKLRVGIDVARGPGTWAYYIVFGSNWVK
jgi:hypothetical protein